MLTIHGLLGVAAGLAAVGFVFLVDVTTTNLLLPLTGLDSEVHGWRETPVGLSWPDASRLWLLLIPAVGGLGSGLLCARIAPEAFGPGTANCMVGPRPTTW